VLDSYSVLETVAPDLCGPVSVVSLGAAKYYLVLVDMGTRFVKIGFFRDKLGVARATTILSWVDQWKRQTNKSIKF
jgi:hypothetical protein